MDYKDLIKEVFNVFKDKLPYDLWNIDYEIGKNGKSKRTNGLDRVFRFAKKVRAWEEHYGNTNPRGCEADGCDVVGPLSYYAFNRAGQKNDEGGYYLIYHTGEAIKTNGNPRKKNYAGPKIPWMEFDHIDAKGKENEIGKVIQSRRMEDILEEMKICQLLCLKHHRAKSEGESGAYGGKTKLPYLEAVNLIKNYIKPKSRAHYVPEKIHARRYSKGALDEAIKKAKNTDLALYDDLKRLPRNPVSTYKEEGFKWRYVTNNESIKNKKKGGL
jgi:hypothetical protein